MAAESCTTGTQLLVAKLWRCHGLMQMYPLCQLAARTRTAGHHSSAGAPQPLVLCCWSWQGYPQAGVICHAGSSWIRYRPGCTPGSSSAVIVCGVSALNLPWTKLVKLLLCRIHSEQPTLFELWSFLGLNSEHHQAECAKHSICRLLQQVRMQQDKKTVLGEGLDPCSTAKSFTE